MKNLFRLSVILTLFFTFSANLQAQGSGLTIFCGGSKLLIENANDTHEIGFNVGANYFLNPNSQIQIGGQVSYARFGIKNADASFSSLELSPVLRIYAGGKRNFYFQGGVGYYIFTTSASGGGVNISLDVKRIGFNAGFGICLGKFVIQPTFSSSFIKEDDSESLKYVNLNVGIRL